MDSSDLSYSLLTILCFSDPIFLFPCLYCINLLVFIVIPKLIPSYSIPFLASIFVYYYYLFHSLLTTSCSPPLYFCLFFPYLKLFPLTHGVKHMITAKIVEACPSTNIRLPLPVREWEQRDSIELYTFYISFCFSDLLKMLQYPFC